MRGRNRRSRICKKRGIVAVEKRCNGTMTPDPWLPIKFVPPFPSSQSLFLSFIHDIECHRLFSIPPQYLPLLLYLLISVCRLPLHSYGNGLFSHVEVLSIKSESFVHLPQKIRALLTVSRVTSCVLKQSHHSFATSELGTRNKVAVATPMKAKLKSVKTCKSSCPSTKVLDGPEACIVDPSVNLHDV
jgi:hypothetical protein